MYQGTTPTLVLTIAGHDLTDANVFVTLENGKKQWTLEGDRLTIAYAEGSSTITISFSSKEESAASVLVGLVSMELL